MEHPNRLFFMPLAGWLRLAVLLVLWACAASVGAAVREGEGLARGQVRGDRLAVDGALVLPARSLSSGALASLQFILPDRKLFLPGCKLPDVPVIVLSIDPCISCTER